MWTPLAFGANICASGLRREVRLPAEPFGLAVSDVREMEKQMATYAWKFAAITLLMVGTAACRTDHGNNFAAAETKQTSADAATTAHTSDTATTAKH